SVIVPAALLQAAGASGFVVHGRITDKDGGYNDYYTTIYPTAATQPDAGGPYVMRVGDAVTLVGHSNLTGVHAPINFGWDLHHGADSYRDAPLDSPTLGWAYLNTLGIT